jgi:hypothetical protein
MFGFLTGNTLQARDVMKIKARRVKDDDYTIVGKVMTIVLEASRNVSVPDPGITARVGLTLEWLNAKNGPVLAVGGVGNHIDHGDLILPFPVPALPMIPDPRYQRKSLEDPLPPRIAQPLEERACGKIRGKDGSTFLVFSPVEDILVQPNGVNGFMRIEGRTNPADGTKLTFLWHVESGAGFFVGGLTQMGVARAA